MKISVIVCTYNRCQSLKKALASVAVSVLPSSVEWEVLVVDNNSHDQTRDVVEEFCCRYPRRFRYLFEPQQGKSHALNAGIRAVHGNVLVFMDDDVTVEPMWLQNLTAALDSGEWAGAGGRILPQWTCTPPRWLPLEERYALAPLAMFDPDLKAGPLNEPPFGTNMAFQKKVFEKYGGFRIDLGPRPDSEIRNEDTEFGRRLLESGERLRYEPTAVIYHSVPANRIQKRYFLTWWFDKARADVREFGISSDNKWFLAGIPLRLFGRLAKWTLQWSFTINSRRRFGAKLKVWGRLGEIKECYRLERDKLGREMQVKNPQIGKCPRAD
jgi:glycosyltransferase involved in cell wall biosynthesis